MRRRPIAIANWKMALTVGEGLAFVQELERQLGTLLAEMDVVVCPPFTALWPLSQQLHGSGVQLGGQNISPSPELARTGEISASLLVDAGARWVMLGHWEVRSHLGDDDEAINRKVHLALEAGLRPILFVGAARKADPQQDRSLEAQLDSMLAGATGARAPDVAFVYEPESAIGAACPSAVEQVAAATAAIRSWLRERWGDSVAQAARIVYGGSVAPEHAERLLACPEVDGLGASRQGRDPHVFAEIVRRIARARLS